MTSEQARDALIDSGIDAVTVDAFMTWHLKNITVWQMFEAEALRLISVGKKHWGAKALAEWIRHERASKEGGQFGDYAVANSFVAYYARVFAIKYPQYKDFFEYREVKGLSSLRRAA